MALLETVVGKEVMVVIKGMDVGMLQKCRVRAAEADRTGNFTRGLPADFYAGPESELSYVTMRTQLYKLSWSELEEHVGMIKVGFPADPAEFERLFSGHKKISEWLCLYARDKLPQNRYSDLSRAMLRINWIAGLRP